MSHVAYMRGEGAFKHAEDAGYEAFWNNEGRDSNPHPALTALWRAWDFGYMLGVCVLG